MNHPAGVIERNDMQFWEGLITLGGCVLAVLALDDISTDRGGTLVMEWRMLGALATWCAWLTFRWRRRGERGLAQAMAGFVTCGVFAAALGEWSASAGMIRPWIAAACVAGAGCVALAALSRTSHGAR